MRHRKIRRFRHHSNGRNHRSRDNMPDQNRLGSSLFSNGRSKNNFRNYQSAEKLVEKYSDLAKEALSSGDRILSENYFQHADHFTRILSEKEHYKTSKNKESNETISENVELTSKQEDAQEKQILKS